MNKKYLTRQLILIVAIIAALLIARLVSASTPITVNTGTATIDGDPFEWTQADFVSTLNNAGDPDKAVFGSVFMRYDCATQTLYIYVTGDNLIQDATAAWATVDGGPKKQYTGSDSPPAFSWIGESGSYEASFSIAPGSYVIQVHAENDTPGTGHQTAAMPGGSPTTGLAFLLACSEDAPTATVTDTAIPTDTPTITPTDTATATPTITNTATETPTPTATDAPSDPATPTPINTPFLTIVITDQPTNTPTTMATPSATATMAFETVEPPSTAPTVTPTATLAPSALIVKPEPLSKRVYLPVVER